MFAGRVKCFNSKHEDRHQDRDRLIDEDEERDHDRNRSRHRDGIRDPKIDVEDVPDEEHDQDREDIEEAAYHTAPPKYRRAVVYAPPPPDEEAASGSGSGSDIYVDGGYNCEYKCKELNMRAIRCSRQQHIMAHYPPHHPHHHRTLMDCPAEAAYTPPATVVGGNPGYLASNGSVQQLDLSNYHGHHPPPPMPIPPPPTHAQNSPHYQSASGSVTATGSGVSASTSISTTAVSPQPSSSGSSGSTASSAAAAAAAAANRRDHNIDYSTLFVQLSGTLPTLYRCVSCNKIVSNRWHHANIHRPQSHECPVCGQKFTRRDNMKAHCKIKHADIKDRFFSHYVHM